MIQFIFFGRVTEEKGINLILDTFSRLTEEWIDNRHLDIYWDGALAWKCKEVSEKNSNISYHGRANMNTIKKKLVGIDYCLMTSTILETFWKSALEAIKEWVPSIWYEKWWQAQFIDEKLTISDVYTLYYICKNLIINNIHPDKEAIKKLFLPYTKESRILIIENTIGKNKKIVHISDFISKIGWIEAYLWESKELLEQNWYTVDLFWTKRKINLFWMFVALWNFPARFKLQKQLQKKYDILRFHSILRWFWHTILNWLPKNTTKIFMIHDLWYFHPYPSKLYNERDIPEFTLKSFLSKGKWVKQKILIIFKFLSLSLIKRKLTKTMDLWFVPSSFLIDIVHTKRDIPKEKIVLLPHFG